MTEKKRTIVLEACLCDLYSAFAVSLKTDLYLGIYELSLALQDKCYDDNLIRLALFMLFTEEIQHDIQLVRIH